MFNNSEEPKNETPAEVIETPVVEAPVAEEPAKVEEAPKEEAPKWEAPAVVGTDSFARSTTEQQTVGSVNDGAIGVATAKPAPKKSAQPKAPKVDKVAIHSTKNVTWSGVGKVYNGYNLVTPEEAEKWLTRSHIRTATPEEVAKEFGK